MCGAGAWRAAWRCVVLRGVATRGEAARVIYAAHLEDVLGHLQVGVHLGPAERVGLARTLTVGGRLHERLGKVVAEERLLLGVAVDERQHREGARELRDPVEQSVLVAEHGGRPQDGRLREGRTHVLLAHSLRAGPCRGGGGGGAERRHVHEPLHTLLSADRAQHGGEGRVHILELPAARLKVLAEQVDHDVGAGDSLLDLIGITNRHVEEVDDSKVTHGLQVPHHDLIPSEGDDDATAHLSQPVNHVAAQKPGATEDGHRRPRDG